MIVKGFSKEFQICSRIFKDFQRNSRDFQRIFKEFKDFKMIFKDFQGISRISRIFNGFSKNFQKIFKDFQRAQTRPQGPIPHATHSGFKLTRARRVLGPPKRSNQASRTRPLSPRRPPHCGARPPRRRSKRTSSPPRRAIPSSQMKLPN